MDAHVPYPGMENGPEQPDIGARKLRETYNRLAFEFPTWSLGPMPVRQWLEEFLPITAELLGRIPSAEGLFQNIALEPATEDTTYESVINTLNGLTNKFKFVSTHKALEQGSDTGSPEPDIAIYPQEVGDISQQTGSQDAFTNLGGIELFIQVQNSESEDCFRDDTNEFIAFDFRTLFSDSRADARRKRLSLGQNVYHAAKLLARQHRRFAFSITMSGSRIRFIRWDRAGAIVSTGFDCRKEPSMLREFLWRLDHLTPEDRGYDMTVQQDADGEHARAFAAALRDRLCFELGIRDDQSEEANQALERHCDPEHVSIVSIPANDDLKRYCISKPLDMPKSVAGRGTRGYWAMDVDSLEVRFLKDTWRKDIPGIKLEGDISRDLSNHGVRNVPEIDRHGDVLSGSTSAPQSTVTQDFIHESWVKRSLSRPNLSQKIVRCFHHRMVSKTVGCNLSEHKDMKELLSAARDMYDAVMDAHEKCERLHRDISANNVILVRDPQTGNRTAHVIDWEISVTTTRPELHPPALVGTWQFISCRVLRRRDQSPHRLDDDLESIFWVIYWFLLIYYSALEVRYLSSTLASLFDSFFESDNGIMRGGDHKKWLLLDPNELLDGLESHPYLKPWLFEYSAYLASGLVQIPRYYPTDSRPAAEDLRQLVFDLVDDIPDNVAKSDPDWERLDWLRHPVQCDSLSAFFGSSSNRNLASSYTVSHATMPVPAIKDHAPSEPLAMGVGNADATKSLGNTTTERVGQGTFHVGSDLDVDSETGDKERGAVKRARIA